jgi:hypothetical protein
MQDDKDPEKGTAPANPGTGEGTAGNRFSSAVQMQIGARLATEYGDVIGQAPPDRFRMLLDHLDRRARVRSPKKSR